MLKGKQPKQSGSSKFSIESDQPSSQSIRNEDPTGDNDGDGEPVIETKTTIKTVNKPPPESMRQKTKKHLRMHWKYYLLGVVLMLAILLPLLFKVFVPLIIQRIVNSRNIELDHASVFIKSSSEIMFSANASVKSPVSARVGKLQFTLHDTIDNKTPSVLTSDIDGFAISKSTTIQIVEKTLHVDDPDALVKWALRFIDGDEIPFDVQVSNIAIFLGKLGYTANVNRPVTIQGLGGLGDLTLDSLKLSLPPVGGRNVQANVSLSNPSSLSVAVGNLTVDFVVSGIKIGEAVANNVALVPGRNQVSIDALLDLALVVNSLATIIRDQIHALQAGNVEVELRITSFTMNGERIQFLEALLRQKALQLRAPLVAVLDGALTGIVWAGVQGMGMRNGTEVGGQTVLDAVGDVFLNKTLMNRIRGHWDRPRNGRRR